MNRLPLLYVVAWLYHVPLLIGVLLAGCAPSTGSTNIISPPTDGIRVCSEVARMRDVLHPGWSGYPYAVVTGQVYSIEGKPLREAVVHLHEPDRSPPQGTLSDSLGAFRIDSVAPGPQVIRIRAIGYRTQDHHMVAVAGATESICAILQFSS
jgi:hypothetical protein